MSALARWLHARPERDPLLGGDGDRHGRRRRVFETLGRTRGARHRVDLIERDRTPEQGRLGGRRLARRRREARLRRRFSHCSSQRNDAEVGARGDVEPVNQRTGWPGVRGIVHREGRPSAGGDAVGRAHGRRRVDHDRHRDRHGTRRGGGRSRLRRARAQRHDQGDSRHTTGDTVFHYLSSWRSSTRRPKKGTPFGAQSPTWTSWGPAQHEKGRR